MLWPVVYHTKESCRAIHTMSLPYSSSRSEIKPQQLQVSPINSLKYLFQKGTDT